MYFDFDDYRPDTTPVGRVISWREGILLSIMAHMAGLIALLLLPRWFPYSPETAALKPTTLVETRNEERPRFVFVAPKFDREAFRAPPRAPLSDKNREARTPETVPVPTNTLPASRGNTPERVEQVEPEVARGQGPALTRRSSAAPTGHVDAAEPKRRHRGAKLPESQSALALPGSPLLVPPGVFLVRQAWRYSPEPRPVAKNLQFDNADGGKSNQFGQFQFDTKGVEFGPWIRRFAAQVRRNWDPLIPNGNMQRRDSGHVVVTLNIHKDGSITDVTVVGPCPIPGYNNAAMGALMASHPTQPLPPEYPAEKAFFTITFYYNERPPDW